MRVVEKKSPPSYQISHKRQLVRDVTKLKDITVDRSVRGSSKKPSNPGERPHSLSFISGLGIPKGLLAPGWRRAGGMEELHIPAGWHKTSHQWTERVNGKIIPHFSKVEMNTVRSCGVEKGISLSVCVCVWGGGISTYFF